MQAYDLLMLIVLALAIVWGAWKGLAWQIASLASIALSYLVALNFRQPLAGIIDASPPWNIFSAMLILFLGTGLVVWIGFNLVSELIERVKLKEFDRQLGAIFGAAKGVLLCVLITLFSVALLGDGQRQAICNSKSGYYIAVLLDRADAVIPKELHEVLEPYIDRFDRSVPHVHAEGEPLTLPGGWDIPPRQPQAGVATDTPGGWPILRDVQRWFSRPQSNSPAPAAPGLKPLSPFSFPTAEPGAASFGAEPSRTARRIEAEPAPPPSSEGSFKQW
jgi:membrane protein required for colicin V production